MSDLVKRLRESRSMWENARGVPSDLESEAADRIEQLEAQLSAADALAGVAHGFTYEYGHRSLEDALTAYRETRQ